MLVSELIDLLKNHNPDDIIVVPAGKYGNRTPTHIQPGRFFQTDRSGGGEWNADEEDINSILIE